VSVWVPTHTEMVLLCRLCCSAVNNACSFVNVNVGLMTYYRFREVISTHMPLLILLYLSCYVVVRCSRGCGQPVGCNRQGH
jgi:hypothetical protein